MNSAILIFFVSNFLVASAANSCMPKYFGFDSFVCVCNLFHCDTIDPVTSLPEGEYVVYTSDRESQRFNKSTGSFSYESEIPDYNITVNSDQKYQNIFGFGSAFTDSAAINIMSLFGPIRDKLMQSYFSNEGIEYSLCRVPIGGTDFSIRDYTYDDVAGDVNLEHFSLTYEDYIYKIPLIKQALKLRNENLNFVASPWTAPSWAKTNNESYGFGFLYLKYYQFWAEYYLKFLESYEKENISIWGITTGNEPILAYIPFVTINTMAWTPATQSKWIAENLGPTIRNSKYNNTKILMLDDQRAFLPWVPQIMFANKATKNYVDGFATHWYVDQFFPIELLDKTNDLFPDKFILSTEAANGLVFNDQIVHLGSWLRAETYAADIIGDLNHWTTGWIDWNMALDEKGGPTYIHNYVDSPIIVNAVQQEFYKNPMFYAMGHFSKFIPANSVRVNCTINTSIPTNGTDFMAAAFQRPDNGTTVVILNSTPNDLNITVTDPKRGIIERFLTKHSLTTILYW